MRGAGFRWRNVPGSYLIEKYKHDEEVSSILSLIMDAETLMIKEAEDPEQRLYDAIFGEGGVYIKEGAKLMTEASSRLRSLLKKSPENADLHYMLAYTYRRQEKHNHYLRELRKAVKLAPVWEDTFRKILAQELAEEAMMMYPEKKLAGEKKRKYIRLAKECLSICDEILKVHSYPEFRSYKAWLLASGYAVRNGLDQAIEELRKVTGESSNSKYKEELGRMYMKKRDYKKALYWLVEALGEWKCDAEWHGKRLEDVKCEALECLNHNPDTKLQKLLEKDDYREAIRVLCKKNPKS